MSKATPFTIPADWIEQCHRNKVWCENFLAEADDNGELVKLFGDKVPQSSDSTGEKADVVAKQCAGFEKGSLELSSCVTRKSILYEFEKAYPSTSTSTLWIGLGVGVPILLIGAFLLYWLFFRNKEEHKETKSKADK